jgi:taurine dioxygenase
MTVSADSDGVLTDYQPGPRVPARWHDGWVDEPITRFGLTGLSPSIGAVVDGVSLADDLDDELFHQLNRALLEWKVLFFRDQHITPEQHAAFAAHWGPLESHPFFRVTFGQPEEAPPEVVRFEKGTDVAGYENVWHSDVSWREIPSLGSVLRAVEVPELGGDTLWSDMGAAYDGLDDATKVRIADLVAEHDWLTSFGLTMDAATRDELRKDFPPVRHPVVRHHPETGRKMLYVNRIFTQHIVGMDPDEGRFLLEQLWLQAAFPEYQCRWRWQPGDVAFWDNRSTQHYATSDYFPNRRVMERITVIGDRPF